MGATIGHYRIVRELGRGGMGVVYLAHDLVLDREVALKTPHHDSGHAEERHRFLREVRAAARLSHPHIAPVFDVFEHGGQLWVAMAYVDGQTLRASIDTRGPAPPLEVVRLAEGVLDALVAAHAKGLLHRDINPNNIMLTADGRPLLMDFGLALTLSPGVEGTDSTHTSPTRVSNPGAGTPAYMSPEQILGDTLDVRSDLFSFGAVMYELCTARHPFPAPRPGAVYEAILTNAPVPLARSGRHRIPVELERIILKALARRPDERYQTASDLLADVRALRRAMESGTSIDRPVVVTAPWRRSSFLALAIALAGLGALAAWMWRQAPAPEATPRQVTSLAGWETDPVVSPDGSLIAFTSDESGNADVWLLDARSNSALRLTTDAAIDRAPAWFPDGSAIAFVSTRAGGPGIFKVGRLGGEPVLLVENAESPAVAPDGRRIAFVRTGPSGQRRVFVADLADPSRAHVVSRDEDGLWDHSDPAWSPDGRRICYAAARDLWITTPAGGPATRLTADGEVDFEPEWSPGGQTVYFSSYRDGTLALWRVASGGGRPVRMTMGTGPERHPSVSRDGASVVYTTVVDDRDLVLRDLATGDEQVMGSARDDHAPSLSPDGTAVAFVSDRLASRFDLWVQPLASGRTEGVARRLTDHPGSVAQPAYSPDGRWLAYHRVLDGQRDVWVVASAGGTPVRFTTHAAVDIHPAWAPDGRTIAFISERSGESKVWIGGVDGGRPIGEPWQLTTGPAVDEAPVWSPDGQWIAFLRSSPSGVSDVWLQAASRPGPGRRLTSGARVGRAHWSRVNGDLLVLGRWGGDAWQVRRVSPETGAVSPFDTRGDLGMRDVLVHFDVSGDERWLAFARATLKGDIWRLNARAGAY